MEALVNSLLELGAEHLKTADVPNLLVDKSNIIKSLELLKDADFNILSDLFAIDYSEYPGHESKRFAVVYNIYSLGKNKRIFLRIELDEGEEVATATDLWKSALVLEREIFDMFGIKSIGHPNLVKLHTPDDLEGHPLLKDFPLGESPTLFNDGRFIDPSSFRASLKGDNKGLTGYKGGARRGVKRVRK